MEGLRTQITRKRQREARKVQILSLAWRVVLQAALRATRVRLVPRVNLLRGLES